MLRKFEITVDDAYYGTVQEIDIEIHEDVFKQVDDEWRNTFYQLMTDIEVVKHIAHNMVNNNLTLSRMDGFANLPDHYAKVTYFEEMKDYDYDVHVEELTDKE